MRKYGILFLLLEIMMLVALCFLILSCRTVSSSTSEQLEKSENVVIKIVENYS